MKKTLLVTLFVCSILILLLIHLNQSVKEKGFFLNQIYFNIIDISDDLLDSSKEKRLETYTNFYTLHILFEQKVRIKNNIYYPPMSNFEDIAELIINDNLNPNELNELKIDLDCILSELSSKDGLSENTKLTYSDIEKIFTPLFKKMTNLIK